MNSAILGLYGLYFVLVGFNGNTDKFITAALAEKQFVSWIVAVMILGFLYNNKTTNSLVAPFATLLVITLVVTKASTIETQVKSVYNSLSSGAAAT